MLKNTSHIVKNEKHKIKKKRTIKIGKQPETTYCLGCKDYTQNFGPEKVLREKSHCVVCRSNKSRFLKQKIN